jgi:hypothetical protein
MFTNKYGTYKVIEDVDTICCRGCYLDYKACNDENERPYCSKDCRVDKTNVFFEKCTI